MMKKSRLMTTVICLFMTALVLTGCGKSKTQQELERLQEENAALRAQVDSLRSQLTVGDYPQLDSWALDAYALNGSDPVSIHFTAVPTAYEQGQTASLLVTLNGSEEVVVPCNWDGSVQSAFVTLLPQDGYGYYYVLTEPTGSQVQIPLSTPENPVKPSLTFLATSLANFCNLFLDDWSADAESITIRQGTVLVQLPLISDGGDRLTCTEAELVMELNGEEIQKWPIPLMEGETAGSFTADLSGTILKIPAIHRDDQLDLLLYAPISDGRILTSEGGSWFFNGESLDLVVG